MTELRDDFLAFLDGLSAPELAQWAQVIDKLFRAKLRVKADPFSVVYADAQALSESYWVVQTWALGQEKLPPGFPSPGNAAVVQWARALNDPIADLLAGLLEPTGSFDKRLVLKGRRGRPSNRARQATKDLRLGKTIETEIKKQTVEAETQRGHKPNRKAVTGTAAAKVSKGRSNGYAARAKFKRAKSLEILEEE
jgi:hypothetical protein